jgi:predicted AAA+ superfamily ATPase
MVNQNVYHFAKQFDKMHKIDNSIFMDIARLFELDQLARTDGRQYGRKRALFGLLEKEKGRHFTGIVGPRGAGKTVLLKQLALAWSDSLYVSMDTIDEEGYFFETIRFLVERHGIRLLLLDEIHLSPLLQIVLKKAYELLPVRIVFTSSVALAMHDTAADLARRVKLVTLNPFTFREYLFFSQGIDVPPLSMESLVAKEWSVEHFRHGFRFEEYLKGGLYPFTLQEPDSLPFLRNILEKIVRHDIPLVARLMTDELPKIEKSLAFIGRSPVDGINYTSVARNVGITSYKAEAYIRLLERAFVLNPVFPVGTNVLKEPKVLMRLPFRLLYQPYDQALGALREDFFCEAMRVSGQPFHYLKTVRGAKTPDYMLGDGKDGLVFEVGGRSKGREQFKGIRADRTLVLAHGADLRDDVCPLFMLGYLSPAEREEGRALM